jgi:hypothetical protein
MDIFLSFLNFLTSGEIIKLATSEILWFAHIPYLEVSISILCLANPTKIFCGFLWSVLVVAYGFNYSISI